MWNKARVAYSILGLAILVIGLPTTIRDGIAGWAAWLHWIGKGEWQSVLFALGVLIIAAANLPDLIRRSSSAEMPTAVTPADDAPARRAVESEPAQQRGEEHAERRSESEPVPGEISVADLRARVDSV
jgi:hypothetical protein